MTRSRRDGAAHGGGTGAVPVARRAVLRLGAGGAAALAGSAVAWPGLGQERRRVSAPMRFFRIGTASTSGTYFPIGGIIANAISNPPGSRPCEQGGSCGVPGLIAVVQSTDGSVDNVRQIAAGTLDSGFVQADVAYWAYHGTGLFERQGPVKSLRALANLYPEAIHVVVRRGIGIRGIPDLAGKRVSLDREGSGTRVDALLILQAFGLGPEDIDEVAVAAGSAADMMHAGELDAFFFVAGTPANAVVGLAEEAPVTLVPIHGEPAQRLQERYPFFAADTIAAGTYMNVPATPTLSVGAQWIIAAELPAETVYQISRALWHPNTRRLLDSGHPKGRLITLETALDGVGIPLHPGARRYYQEVGILQG